MKTTIKLTLSYLIIGFLVLYLAYLKRSSGEKKPFNIKRAFLRLVLFALIVYVLPLCVFIVFNFFKVVIVQKYTMYQFKEYVYTVLFNQFNGYYIAIWKWVVSLFKKIRWW